MSRPEVHRQGRKLHISYKSTTRLNCSQIYPIKSSNGSTIAISGTAKGVHLTWSGGKSLFTASKHEASHTNGVPRSLEAAHITAYPDSDDEALFDSDDEDLDDDQPYPATVQDLDIALGSAVLEVAVPGLDGRAESDHVPEMFYDHIMIAVACEDGTGRVIALPIDPPSENAKRKGKIGAQVLHLDSGSRFDLATGIAITWGSHEHSGDERYELRHANEQTRLDGSLTVALSTSAHSGQLHLYSLPIVSADGRRRIYAKGTTHPTVSDYLDAPATAVEFSNGDKSGTRLLVSDIRGFISVFDVGFLPHNLAVPSKETLSTTAALQTKIKLSAPYGTSRSLQSPGQNSKKKILAAHWTLDGDAILVLLEDGHVGLFALSSDAQAPTQTPPKPYSFACETFIGDAPEHLSATATTSTRARKPQLAPMTPNTRRTKSGALFVEPTPASSSSTPRGGMAVLSLSASDKPDSAVVLWYNNSIFSIPSLRTFWAQSDRTDSMQGFPGSRSAISSIDTPELNNETIVSVALLPSTSSAAPKGLFGTSAITHDILLTAEHQSIVLSHIPAPAATLLAGDESPSRAVDARRLGRLELGLDGMDRMLDDMDAGRRVGFTE